MSLRKRTSTGQYASEENPERETDVVVLHADTPSSSKLSRTGSKKKTSGSFAKSTLRIMVSGKKAEDQIDLRETLTNDCQTIYRNAKFFSTITTIFYNLSQVLKFLVAIYFIMNVFIRGILYSITAITLHCTLGRGKDFYSKMKETIFPEDMITSSPHIEIIVRESGTIGSEALVTISFPLTINNPFIQLIILMILVFSSFFMVYFQRVLVKVARLAKDASPEPDFEAKYGQLPEQL